MMKTLLEYPKIVLAVTDETKNQNPELALRDWFDLHLINLSNKPIKIRNRLVGRVSMDDKAFDVSGEIGNEIVLNNGESKVIDGSDLDGVYDLNSHTEIFIDNKRYYLNLKKFINFEVLYKSEITKRNERNEPIAWKINRNKTTKWKKFPRLKEKVILFDLDGNLL